MCADLPEPLSEHFDAPPHTPEAAQEHHDSAVAARGLSIWGVRVCSKEFVVKLSLIFLASVFVIRPDLRMETMLMLSFLIMAVNS
mmetsp:Transcript_44939/g.65974  ORF Transcript_44939/g.65974 Transcript_44939/m.65974 type:complete len:85 (+) Transcript_44939:30-284(+)|eukprot:CAMPEP_0173104178 /NCGR_PEP_ID=MMETSP1102-20130122/39009_1 /TAXON_ID=49646 /ORGANISM="Geminigera sp., Strain Caron Lab Isolate" /LENGTH=84 /DNA_ID=CAMNT_0013999491 /DNA_START=28 /DNA_END=282 /DNA_ORIENTATION=-